MLLRFLDGMELEVKPNFNGNLVTIPSPNPNTSGFVVVNLGVPIFDASEYTTLYDSEEDFYILSNDGSVKPVPVPPEPPKPTLTPATLESEEGEFDIDLIDASLAGDISFNVEKLVTPEFLETLTSITADGETYDLTDGYEFVSCEDIDIYDMECYSVLYHKFTEQELVNKQVEQNTANIDFVAMETGVEI